MPGLPDGTGGEVVVRHDDTLGDIKNGKHFADMFRDKLLFVHETGDVLAFEEHSGWVHAKPNEAVRGAKAVVAKLRVQAADAYRQNHEDPNARALMKHVAYSSKDANLQAMIRLAQSEAGMTVRLCEFDDDPMLLGVANRVLDLKKATLLAVSPEVLVSKRCNVAYDPNSKCPRFLKYLVEIQPDVEIRDFLQRIAGYCLTGRTDEHVFLFLYGHGANGKSVFVELMNWLLGDYANKIQTEMLMRHQRSPQGASSEIVALKGLRFVYANETSEGGD
jgi:putative DNA primase/helicase